SSAPSSSRWACVETGSFVVAKPGVRNGLFAKKRLIKNHQLDDFESLDRQSGSGMLGSRRFCNSSSNRNADAKTSRLNPSVSSVCSSARRVAEKSMARNCSRFRCIQLGERQSAAGVEKL